MTAFQTAALLTPAFVGLALLLTAAFVRRQNTAPQCVSPSPSEANLKEEPIKFTPYAAVDVLPTLRSEADDMEFALAAIRERMAVSPHVLADVSVEIGVLSDDIHRKLDRMTELAQSKTQARS